MTDQPDLPPELLERCQEVLYAHYWRAVRAVAPVLIAHGREAGAKAMQEAIMEWLSVEWDAASWDYESPVQIIFRGIAALDPAQIAGDKP